MSKTDDELIALETTSLEKLKVIAEIRQHELAWWKRPAYIGALIPGVVAAFTIYQLISTGYFQNQRTLLMIEAAHIQNKTKELETKKKDTEAELEKARADLQSEKKLIVQERKEMQTEMTSVRQAHREQIVDLKRETMISQVDSIINLEDFNPQHDASNLLIEMVRQRKDVQSLLKEKISSSQDSVLKANLLYAMFKATDDKNWLDKLKTLAQTDPENYAGEFWDVFGMGNWGEEKQQMWEFIIALLNQYKLSVDARTKTLLAFYLPSSESEETVDLFNDKAKFFDLIVHARDLAQNDDFSANLRSFQVLFYLSPEAYLTLLANKLSDKVISPQQRIDLISFYQNEIRMDERHKERFESLSSELNFPKNAQDDWEAWLARHQNLVIKWVMDETLVKARENYEQDRERRVLNNTRLFDEFSMLRNAEIVRNEKQVHKSTLNTLTEIYIQIDQNFAEGKELASSVADFYTVGEYKGTMQVVLLPINGVVLGQTTEEELDKLGKRNLDTDETDIEYPSFVVDGIVFWADSQLAESIYLTYSDPMPVRWRLVGFDWDLSYDDWQTLLEALGWEIELSKDTLESKGNGPFSAKVVAQSEGLTMSLDFNYRDGNLQSSPSTLYSFSLIAD